MFFSLNRFKTFEKVSKKMKDILEIFLQMLFFILKMIMKCCSDMNVEISKRKPDRPLGKLVTGQGYVP